MPERNLGRGRGRGRGKGGMCVCSSGSSGKQGMRAGVSQWPLLIGGALPEPLPAPQVGNTPCSQAEGAWQALHTADTKSTDPALSRKLRQPSRGPGPVLQTPSYALPWLRMLRGAISLAHHLQGPRAGEQAACQAQCARTKARFAKAQCSCIWACNHNPNRQSHARARAHCAARHAHASHARVHVPEPPLRDLLCMQLCLQQAVQVAGHDGLPLLFGHCLQKKG